MYLWTFRMLAQIAPYDDAPAPAPPPQRPMSFSDLKAGLRAYNTGETNDNGFRNCVLVLVAVVAVIVLVIHLRQRQKTPVAKDSPGRLGWDLARKVRFPAGSRIFLMWVARGTGVPFASLLLSAALYDKCVAKWAGQPTFTLLRRWGRGRLRRLRPELFA